MIDNAGTAGWSDGQVQFNGGTLNNLAGGVFTATAANSFFNAGGTNAFTNAGAFVKNSSSISIVGVPFTNQASGTVNVNDGTLVFGAGGTNQGAVTIASGATVRFGGNFTHAAGSTLTGVGNVDFNTTTVSLDGNLFIDGELSFNARRRRSRRGRRSPNCRCWGRRRPWRPAGC